MDWKKIATRLAETHANLAEKAAQRTDITDSRRAALVSHHQTWAAHYRQQAGE